jgi:hypothetical protein
MFTGGPFDPRVEKELTPDSNTNAARGGGQVSAAPIRAGKKEGNPEIYDRRHK